MTISFDLETILEVLNAVLGVALMVVAIVIGSRYSKNLNKAMWGLVAVSFFMAIHEIIHLSKDFAFPGLSEVVIELPETLALVSLLLAAYYGLKMKLLELET